MVVKLFFADRVEEVVSFTFSELDNLKLLDKLMDYFMEKMNPEFMIGSYEISEKIEEGYFKFDLRDYFNYSNSFIGLELEGRVVDRVEFFDEGTYEYNLDSLDSSSSVRYVKFNYPYEYYDISRIRGRY